MIPFESNQIDISGLFLEVSPRSTNLVMEGNSITTCNGVTQ